MTKQESSIIAEKITNEEILEMFENAKQSITDWNVVSKCNRGLSKGCAWNILAEDFDVNKKYHIMAIKNMVREFGEYLPNHLKPVKKVKAKVSFVHHEPRFKLK